MSLLSRPVFFCACFFSAVAVYADRGPIVWNEEVALSQESQKVIMLHNGTEEILILGTEMKAVRETEILEFIPFPSEPEVRLAPGNPFGEIGQLIREKGLIFQSSDDFGKGGAAGGTASPVEIRFSETIGLHDVTTIKINDVEGFTQWLEGFFDSRGIPTGNRALQDVYDNARDYMQRGYRYFVFDSVKITPKLQFLEPLEYRFRTDKIYFPLKTSNLIGGTGTVEMIFLLPGSITDDIWQHTPIIFGRGQDREIRLSSSSKLYSEDVKRIHTSGNFFGRSKVYLQALKYKGRYEFVNDFTYDVNKLVAYAYRFQDENPVFGQLETGQTKFVPPLSPDERRDMREAFCPKMNAPDNFLSSIQIIQMDCWDYIDRDEYALYDALFCNHQLPGIPEKDVILESMTVPLKYSGGYPAENVDEEIVRNFNEKNKMPYRLENGFPYTSESRIRLRSERDKAVSQAKISVSRAGFTREGDKALVYVSYSAGENSGVAYFVVCLKKGNDWVISGYQPVALH